MSGSTVMFFQMTISLILSFLIPFSVFHFLQNKKAVDTYFSLPISRKKILVTGLLFSILAIYLPFVISLIFNSIINNVGFIATLLLCILSLLSITTLVLFNVAIYSLANNVLDGVVVLGAYTMLPLGIAIALSNYIYTYVCGSSSKVLDFIGYLSPTYIGSMLLRKALPEYDPLTSNQYIQFILMSLLFIALSIYLLNKHFVNRQAERADSISDNILTYPFIIFIYMLLVMLAIISLYNFSVESIWGFVSNNLISYILLFAIFMIAYFLYKRKLSFNYKLPLIFIIAMACSLLFAELSKNTHCFGLVDKYLINDPKAKYTIYNYQYNYTDERGYINYDKEVFEYFSKALDQEVDYLEINIRSNHADYSPNQETIDIFERLRKTSIDEFYSKNMDQEYQTNLSIDGSDGYRNYNIHNNMTLADILALSKDKANDVYISTNDNTYQLDVDGKLQTVIMTYYNK
jgi:hypothetical protein